MVVRMDMDDLPQALFGDLVRGRDIGVDDHSVNGFLVRGQYDFDQVWVGLGVFLEHSCDFLARRT